MDYKGPKTPDVDYNRPSWFKAIRQTALVVIIFMLLNVVNKLFTRHQEIAALFVSLKTHPSAIIVVGITILVAWAIISLVLGTLYYLARRFIR